LFAGEKMKKARVGIIGFGTVGSGVAKLLTTNRDFLKKSVGLDIELTRICDTDITTSRGVTIDPSILTTDVSAVIDADDIDVVVELIGGINPAFDFISRALNSGKNVVTANKALLATKGIDLFASARANNACLKFEGSVGGGIPVLNGLTQGLAANRIQTIYGIVNGTCNYILTKMVKEHIDFGMALKDAMDNGYAEADPGLDIDGIDSGHKLAILSTLAFGKYTTFDDVYVEGIRNISSMDIEFAARLGYVIKLLVIAKENAGKVEVRVHPTMIPVDSQLGKTDGVYNAIEITGDFVQNVLFYGRGAGAEPTASAVVSDIIEIAKRLGQSEAPLIPIGYNPSAEQESKEIMNVLDIESRYYMRIKTADKPGVLADISKMLAEHSISIASVEQLETFLKEKSAVIIIITHRAQERDMQASLKILNGREYILEDINLIRIEDI